MDGLSADHPTRSGLPQLGHQRLLVQRVHLARTTETALISLLGLPDGEAYRAVLWWVLIEDLIGRETYLKRCYLSMPFSEKTTRRVIGALIRKGCLEICKAADDKRRFGLRVTPKVTHALGELPDASLGTALEMSDPIASA